MYVRPKEGPCRGERHHRAKLTEEKVRFIRSANEKGCYLAAFFGVTKENISQIRNRKSWKHVAD